MLRLTIFLITCSFIGCTTIERPDSFVCVALVEQLHERCFNLKADYDDTGKLKPDAKPTIIQYQSEGEMLKMISKKVTIDPLSWANIKAYIRELRNALPK